MTDEKDVITEKPKAGASDIGYITAKVILSAVPVVGGPAKELLSNIITPPLQKRQWLWVETLAIRLTELEKQVAIFKIESLSNNDNFISSVLHATTIALRSHQTEKLDALRNAVLNTAIDSNTQDNLCHMFLNCIDDFTPLHILILKYFENPEQWIKNKGLALPNYVSGGAITIFNHAFPELVNNKDLAQQIVNDLFNKGLSANWESMHTSTIRSGMFGPRITQLGRKFLAFITSPIIDVQV